MIEHEKQIDDVKKVDLTNELYYIKKLKCIRNWIDVFVAKEESWKIEWKMINKLNDIIAMNCELQIYINSWI
jgi:hypothetical protein